MERKEFGELSLNSYFKFQNESFKKTDIDYALNLSKNRFRKFEIYEEVEVIKSPSFILNY